MARILVVDDNENNRILIRDILVYNGYEVIEAKDGDEAVKLSKELTPDLVLMDIQMPLLDGYAAGRAIRSDPATKELKLIAVTSYAMKNDREKILATGFSDYLAKPIDTRALPGQVKRWLELKG